MTDAEVLVYFVFALAVAFVLTPLLLGGVFFAFSTRNPEPWNVGRTYAIALTVFSFLVNARAGAAHLWVQAIGTVIIYVLAVAVRNRLMLYGEGRRRSDPPAVCADGPGSAPSLARHYPLTE